MTAVLHLAAVVAAASSSSNSASPITALLPIVLIGVVFYFLLIRPQQRRTKAQREMTQSTEVGDEVVTIGGLFGVVREMDDDSVLLEVAPGIELRFRRSAIGQKLTEEAPAPDDAVDEDDTDAGDEPDDSHYLAPDDEFGKDKGSGDKP
jgi:preprotein translocase subunit YajC